MKKSSQQLQATIKNGVLTISVGVSHLPFIVAPKYSETEFINRAGFAVDVLKELKSEDEDGTTLMHLMFDRAAINAIENGSQHVRVKGDE